MVGLDVKVQLRKTLTKLNTAKLSKFSNIRQCFHRHYCLQELQFVRAGRFDGVDVATLARTTTVWEEGCSVCRSSWILCSQNTTDFREKGKIYQMLTWNAWGGPKLKLLCILPYALMEILSLNNRKTMGTVYGKLSL